MPCAMVSSTRPVLPDLPASLIDSRSPTVLTSERGRTRPDQTRPTLASVQRLPHRVVFPPLVWYTLCWVVGKTYRAHPLGWVRYYPLGYGDELSLPVTLPSAWTEALLRPPLSD